MCNTATSLSTNQQVILLISKGVQMAKHKASFLIQVMTAPSAQLLSGIKTLGLSRCLLFTKTCMCVYVYFFLNIHF